MGPMEPDFATAVQELTRDNNTSAATRRVLAEVLLLREQVEELRAHVGLTAPTDDEAKRALQRAERAAEYWYQKSVHDRVSKQLGSQ